MRNGRNARRSWTEERVIACLIHPTLIDRIYGREEKTDSRDGFEFVGSLIIPILPSWIRSQAASAKPHRILEGISCLV